MIFGGEDHRTGDWYSEIKPAGLREANTRKNHSPPAYKSFHVGRLQARHRAIRWHKPPTEKTRSAGLSQCAACADGTKLAFSQYPKYIMVPLRPVRFPLGFVLRQNSGESLLLRSQKFAQLPKYWDQFRWVVLSRHLLAHL